MNFIYKKQQRETYELQQCVKSHIK